MLPRLILTAVLMVSPVTAFAQEEANGLSFRFGLGPSFEPGYSGSDEILGGVGFGFELERLRFGRFALDNTVPDYGLGPTSSFRIVGGRDADDFDALAGLDDIDLSLEIGGGLEFTTPNYDAFAVLRYGAIGHESFVAELGGDIYYRPTDQITLSAGPRVLIGDDDYAQTYFGVSGADSLADYDAEGGLISAGAVAEATYAINDDWEVIGTLSYDQLRASAADSPISQSDDQLSGSIVLTRRITFGF